MFRTEFNSEKMQWNGDTTESDLNQSLGQEIFKSLEVYGSRVAQVKRKNTSLLFPFSINNRILYFRRSVRTQALPKRLMNYVH